MAVYCLLAIIKKELKADRDLHEIQQILKVSIFSKMPILRAFSRERDTDKNEPSHNQPSLFNL